MFFFVIFTSINWQFRGKTADIGSSKLDRKQESAFDGGHLQRLHTLFSEGQAWRHCRFFA